MSYNIVKAHMFKHPLYHQQRWQKVDEKLEQVKLIRQGQLAIAIALALALASSSFTCSPLEQ